MHSLFIKYQVPTPIASGLSDYFSNRNTENLLNENQLSQIP